MTAIVTSLEGLTAEWVADRMAPRHPGIALDAVEAAPIEIGPSYHGNLARIVLHGTADSALPAAVVAKLVSHAPAARELGVGMGIYLREALFYETLAPAARLQPPACHGTAYNLDSGLSAILLEDLTALEVGVQAAGYTRERAQATVLQLADHHAAFWNDDTLAGHAWLPVWNQPEMVAFVSGSYAQAWSACKAMYAERLSAADMALGDRLGGALPALMEAIARPPVTLLHGDARYDNLLFDPADPTVPPRTVDWQFVARGRGMQDVAYFLTQSGEATLAATCEGELVAAWHAHLLENGINDYAAAECQDDYRRCTLYSLVYPIFTAVMVAPGDTAQYEAIAVALRRGFDAADRLDTAELL